MILLRLGDLHKDNRLAFNNHLQVLQKTQHLRSGNISLLSKRALDSLHEDRNCRLLHHEGFQFIY